MKRLMLLMIAATLLAGCGWTMTIQPMAAPAATPTATSPPVSPLAGPLPAAAAHLAATSPTFGYDERVAAASDAGVPLRPGSYSCDLLGDDYARCVVQADGGPGGQICVYASGWGACE